MYGGRPSTQNISPRRVVLGASPKWLFQRTFDYKPRWRRGFLQCALSRCSAHSGIPLHIVQGSKGQRSAASCQHHSPLPPEREVTQDEDLLHGCLRDPRRQSFFAQVKCHHVQYSRFHAIVATAVDDGDGGGGSKQESPP